MAAGRGGCEPDYDLERFAGAGARGAGWTTCVPLREAINDSPGEGEFEAYPPERIRTYEAGLAGRGRRRTRSSRGTGPPVSPPGSRWSASTSCGRRSPPRRTPRCCAAHRGRRLGLRMKLAMLAWLREERPDVEAVDTWNAAGNAPMIAINEALGCRKVAETVRFTQGSR